MKRRHHRNPNGHWCRCPWGFGNAEPYQSDTDREKLGSVEHLAIWKEAAKLDWLRSRGDKHPGVPEFLDHLEKHFSSNWQQLASQQGYDIDEIKDRLVTRAERKWADEGVSLDDIDARIEKMRAGLDKQLANPDKPPNGVAEIIGMDPDHFKEQVKLGKGRDTLFPWMVREFKKGNILHEGFQPQGQYQDRMPLTYRTDSGHLEGLEGEDLDMLNRYMEYQGSTGNKGINIDQHDIGHILPQASKWDAGGEEVHDDGYHKIVHLRNRRDLRVEGRRMNHCIGSNGMGYDDKQRDGSGMYYSIRNQRNEPLGTLEMTRSRDHYFKCPTCGKFTPGNKGFENNGFVYKCEDDGTTLGVSPHTYGEEKITPSEGAEVFPVHLKNLAKKPDARFMDAAQFHGYEDGPVPHDAVEAANEFFGQHGHSYIAPDTEEEEEEEEEFEPWWDHTYYVEPPESVDDYLDYHSDPHEWMRANVGEEYDRAWRDAEDHGHEGPDLELNNEPDIEEVFSHLEPDRLEDIDPEQIQRVWNTAHGSGDGAKLRELAQTWLEDQYGNYLDPYGQEGGQGGTFTPEFARDTPPDAHVPRDLTGAPMRYPHLEAWQYPGAAYPQDEYFARNLMHHLEKGRDPQTGDYVGQKGLNQRYPELEDRGIEPRIRPEETPIPERTGPHQMHWWETADPNRHRRNIPNLPYGRGEEPVNHPQHRMPLDQLQLEDRGNGPNAYPNRPRRPDEEGPWTPSGLTTPEEYFAPGEETTRMHQRAIPGMEWQDWPDTYRDRQRPPAGTWEDEPWQPGHQQTLTPYNPNEPYTFEQGEQQGSLVPAGWYIDYRRERAEKTNLPQHLFPPEHYGYHLQGEHNPRNDPNQAGMWDYQTMQDRVPPNADDPFLNNRQTPPNINTLNEPPDPGWGFMRFPAEQTGEMQQGWRDRPFGNWRAKHTPRDSEVHANGRIIRFKGKHYATLPKHEWRLPVIYDKASNQLIVGQPSQQHDDLARQFDMEAPWNEDQEPTHTSMPGFIDTEGDVDPGLSFFDKDFEPDDPDELHDWVEDEYGVRKSDEKRKPNVIWGSYHPRQEDEWVAEDEPDFSATIPESRWQHDSVQR